MRGSGPDATPLGWVAVRLAGVLALRSVRVAAQTCREVWWVVRCLPYLAWALLLLLILLVAAGEWITSMGAAAALGGLVSWPVWDRASWLGVADRSRTRRVRRRWFRVAAAAGLLTHPRVQDMGSSARAGVAPRLLRGSLTRDGVSRLRLAYAPGQTVEDIERAAPALASLLGAYSIRVVPDGPARVTVTLTVRDVLTETSHTPMPDVAALGEGGHPLGRVCLGRTMTGQDWTVDARVHTLVAGATGSGKGSVMWSLLAGVAPAVAAGTVRLVGVDLKAGMELLHGKDLFSALATTPEEAVAVLEREAGLLRDRAKSMAGQDRSHAPTPDCPHVLVVIDEIAALTSYLTDRDLLRRADQALRVILTQGRAPGWTVWAWVQDPRKEAVPQRSLFPHSIGLRLKEAGETEMILGEGRAKTAPCHWISDELPGTGYAITEDGHAQRVRAHYADDDLIHAVAATYPTPHRLGVPDLAEAVDPLAAWMRTSPARTHTRTDGSGAEGDAGVERGAGASSGAPRKPRPPRAPRKPRTPRKSPGGSGSGRISGDAA
jgi:DNA segregation ATPase FtsK/SpoIIIE, S-DNA-T family